MNISREWTCPRCAAQVAVVLADKPERELSCPACWAPAPELPEISAPAAELGKCDRCSAPILPGHAALDYCANCGASTVG